MYLRALRSSEYNNEVARDRQRPWPWLEEKLATLSTTQAPKKRAHTVRCDENYTYTGTIRSHTTTNLNNLIVLVGYDAFGEVNAGGCW